jgi:hypothetical protein
MNRIPVTHAGSLIRPPELLSFLAAEEHGQARDGAAYHAALSKVGRKGRSVTSLSGGNFSA